MLNEPRRGGRNDNSMLVILLLCHPFGVVEIISSSNRGCASLHHLLVAVPALWASLHNRLPYTISPNFVRQFYFRNLNKEFRSKEENILLYLHEITILQKNH